jgi:photosystem II stability/assembly factor-like uncharacterized protein
MPAALADIGLSHNCEGEAFAHEAAVAEATHQSPGLRDQRFHAPQNLRCWGDADVVLGEVDAGFEERDQFEKLRLDRRN